MHTIKTVSRVYMAMATHLREMARRLNKTAKRFTEDCDPMESLCGGETLHPFHCKDIALQDAVINYTRANWGKIGNISFAWGIMQLVRNAGE